MPPKPSKTSSEGNPWRSGTTFSEGAYVLAFGRSGEAGGVGYVSGDLSPPFDRKVVHESADFGVVGDLFQVVPQLTEEINKRKG